LEEWRVGLVYQTISTEKRHVERVQAGRRTLNGTEYRRELVHFLSAITTIGEDGAPELDKQRLIKPNPFLTWPHSLSFEAMADVLMNTYDVKTKYATFKQQDIKHDKDTFGPNRKYWSFVINAVDRVGMNLVPLAPAPVVDQVGPGGGVADDCPSGMRASTTAADGRIGEEVELAMEDEEMQEEEEEGEEEEREEEDEETMLQRATYTSHTDREMTEDALEDMGAYDDDGMNEFQST